MFVFVEVFEIDDVVVCEDEEVVCEDDVVMFEKEELLFESEWDLYVWRSCNNVSFTYALGGGDSIIIALDWTLGWNA